MKRSIIALLIILIQHISRAECSSEGIWAFPENREIKQNSLIILTGYALSQSVLNSLNTKYPVYLISGVEKIKLVVTEKYVTGFELTQVILKPETLPKPEQEYTLLIEGIDIRKNPSRYNSKKNSYEAATYFILPYTDNQIPLVQHIPKEINKHYTPYGCGPGVEVFFDKPATDNSEWIVKATVKDIITNESFTALVIPGDSTIRIGHGMCSGEFAIEPGMSYEVSFVFMDACGNLSVNASTPVAFIAPKISFE